jgi:hypothetical protein
VTAWVAFALMAGAVIAAFRAAREEVFARHALRSEAIVQRQYAVKHEAALTWAFRAAGCLVLLSLGGLWRVAHMVTR